MKKEYSIMGRCMCGRITCLYLDQEQAEQAAMYLNGRGLIQDVCTSMNPFEKEFLMTGTCPDCQEELFDRICPNREDFVDAGYEKLA